ncbi:GNAT family N-acetyltransferase [Acetivibrio cellulolyticus]|uniref:GNAT family N-acetyltransferase n=1 Tax=Acetivibrio cellulolyticus TaxID=35830 RepID=UPI0001E2BDED|nr:GNAT family N-acetyltransferase [Acetivibrio cellulolyticus]
MKIEFVNELPSVEEYKFLRSSVGWNIVNDEGAVKKGIEGSLYCVLAKDGDKTVGIGRVVGDGGIMFTIVDIIAIPEYQGCGIGKTIVKNIMDWIEKNCVKGTRIMLCAAEGRESFYEQFGFIKRPTSGYGAGMHWDWAE